MFKHLFQLSVCTVLFLSSAAQKSQPAADSLAYYDDLFTELDDFLDSLAQPRTMLLLSAGVSNNYFNIQKSGSNNLQQERKLTYNPSVGYFHKSGLGLNAAASVINDGDKLNPYQAAITASYDYLGGSAFVGGVSLTRFLTKDSLSFYTSPLQNEASFYVMQKRWWFKPSVTVSYGWGSRSAYEERKEYITNIRLRPRGYSRINTTESIADLSVVTSVRHDFYWRELLGKTSVLRLTPQILFTSGTQRFGFNQTSNTYALSKNGKNSLLYNSENVELDDEARFQPLSLTAFLKGSIGFGNFALQPQAGLDYYFPAKEKNLTPLFTINASYIIE